MTRIVKDGKENTLPLENITEVIVNGEKISVDYYVKSKNNPAFFVKSLDKGLQAASVYNFSEIPRAPSQAPSSIIAANAFVCGDAAKFHTKNARILSGIYVAHMLKEYCLFWMTTIFTVVTKNWAKAQEIEWFCGPVLCVDPKDMLFAVNVSPDNLGEARKKQRIVDFKILQGTGTLLHELSSYYVLDASALNVFAKEDDPRLKIENDISRGQLSFSSGYNTIIDNEAKAVRHAPGTDVKNYMEFIDLYPEVGVEQNGNTAQWQITVVLGGGGFIEKNNNFESKEIKVFLANETYYGEIAFPKRGEYGFGFDSVFVPSFQELENANKLTYAELGFEKKCHYSARTKALEWLIIELCLFELEKNSCFEHDKKKIKTQE